MENMIANKVSRNVRVTHAFCICPNSMRDISRPKPDRLNLNCAWASLCARVTVNGAGEKDWNNNDTL